MMPRRRIIFNHRSNKNYLQKKTPAQANHYMDIPNLMPIHNDSCSSLDLSIPLSRESSTTSLLSEDSCGETLSSARRVSFCEKVAVQEFHRQSEEDGKNTWYTPEEQQVFSKEVARLIHLYNNRTCHRLGCLDVPKHKHLHSHPALAASVDHDNVPPNAQNQIKRILLVDSHDLSLNLFAKAFQRAFPQAIISTATGSKEALFLCKKAAVSFDLVLVEEQLSLFHRSCQRDSGSELLKVLHQTTPHSLFVGVSAHIERDHVALVEAGADLCWSKPPPPLDEHRVEQIFQRLMSKRNFQLQPLL